MGENGLYQKENYNQNWRDCSKKGDFDYFVYLDEKVIWFKLYGNFKSTDII